MKINIQILGLIVLMATASGCSKFRELTRRDYALLKDPFLDRTAVAEEAEEKPPIASVASYGTSGVAVATDLTADESIRTASQTKPSGPTEFGGIRVRGMGDAIKTDIGTPGNPIASNSPDTPLDDATDMADFAAFVKNEAVESGLTETAQEIDKDMGQWFEQQNAEWKQQAAAVEEQAQPFINPARQVRQAISIETHPDMPTLPALGFGEEPSSVIAETATPLIRKASAATASWVVPTPTVSERQVAAEIPIPSKDVFAPNPFADTTERTTPINASPSRNRNAIAPMVGAGSPENPFATVAGNKESIPEPVFDDASTEEKWSPFSGFDSHPSPAARVSAFEESSSEAEPTPAAAQQKPLDTGFNFDSGWRPSNMKH